MECNLRANRQTCPCTYEPCSRKGKCCECIAYHRANDELPACYFTPEVERTYDRSVARFIASRKR
ncbi:hypothetical protein JXD38_07270 [candidate division WOR-3 bacterium]|nr:hypothetical protein [candidate division WOR-3 bacterium]